MIVWTKIRSAFVSGVNVWMKKAVSIGHSHATKSNWSIHFTLIVEQHFVNSDQNFPIVKSITGVHLNKTFNVL